MLIGGDILIDRIRYKIDKKGNIGVRLKSIIKRRENSVRIEALVFLGENGNLLIPFKTDNNIFVPTNDFVRQTFFMFNMVTFIGKAIVIIDSNGVYESVAIAEANYKNSGVSPGSGNDGDIVMSWRPINVSEQLEFCVKQYINNFIY